MVAGQRRQSFGRILSAFLIFSLFAGKEAGDGFAPDCPHNQRIGSLHYVSVLRR
jgi:hypothetical protein